MISQDLEEMNMNKTVATLLISGSLLLLAGCASTSDQFEAYVQNGDYSKAIEAYTTEIQGNAAMELDADEFLSTYLDDKWNQYLTEELDSSEFDVTMATYQKLVEAIPIADYENIQQEYATVEQARAAYSEGMEAMEDKDYVGAISTLTGIPETADETYADAQEQLEQAKSAYCEEILEIANESIAESDYDSAISVVQEAENLIGPIDAFTTFYKETYTEKYETEIANAAEASDFATILKLYEEATENSYVTISSTMTSTYANSIDQYRQSIITQSIDTYKESGFAEANAVVSEGLEQLPGDEKLVRLSELYLSCSPVKLNDIEEMDRSKFYDTDERVTNKYGDNITASYYTASYYGSYKGDHHGKFFTNGKYTTFEFSILTENFDTTYEISISGENGAIFDSGEISWEEGLKLFSVDITGIKQLVISVNVIEGEKVYLGEEQLYRTLTDEDFAEFL